MGYPYGIINQQAINDSRKVMTGKNGALYDGNGKLLATMETYQAQINITNSKYQPLGDPQEHEIFTSFGQTLTCKGETIKKLMKDHNITSAC